MKPVRNLSLKGVWFAYKSGLPILDVGPQEDLDDPAASLICVTTAEKQCSTSSWDHGSVEIEPLPHCSAITVSQH